MLSPVVACLFAAVLLQSSVWAAALAIDRCCVALSIAIGSSKVLYRNSSLYNESTATYFAQQEQLSPACYLKPTSSQDVSLIVKTLLVVNPLNIKLCPFAVKSGGHHTVIGIANINNGITIDLGSMNQTTLNGDKTIASIGAGARWGSVYKTLVPQGLAVLGGRESDIGVGGFTTGGGISYFGAQYGFGADQVSNFEIVLSSGAIKNVNAQQSPDLFQALKGGQNNFGIVTRFDMKTFALGRYFGGSTYYLGSKAPQLIDAFKSFVVNPNFDNKAGLFISNVYAANQGGFVTLATFSYTEPLPAPPVFSNFSSTNIQPLFSTAQINNLAYFADSLGGELTPNSLRQTSITATVKPVGTLLQDIWVLWNATVPLITSASNLITSLTLQPLPVNMIAQGPLNGGNVLGLKTSDGPLVVLTLTIQYSSVASDATVTSASRDLFRKIEARAAQLGGSHPFKYVNYVDESQDPVGSYGPANVQKLKAASIRYDPTGFFQKVQPGGFKVCT